MKNSLLKGQAGILHEQSQQRLYSLNEYEKLVKYKKETTWWLPLITNVKVESRYIALGHDTYREPPYRYCIDISPYRLIPSANRIHLTYLSKPHCPCLLNTWFVSIIYVNLFVVIHILFRYSMYAILELKCV